MTQALLGTTLPVDTAQPKKAERRLRMGQEFWSNRFGDFLLLLIVMFALFPIFWMVITSFKSNQEIVNNRLFPSELRWRNYVDLWDRVNFGTSFINSIVISTLATVVATFFSTCAGYALARFKFPGAPVFGGAVIATQLVPGILMMLPLYLTFVNIKRTTNISIIGTPGGLIMLYVAFYIPLSLWIVRGFFAAIPTELEEAAQIDGASQFQSFWMVALPLARPGIVATAIYVFLTAWDELFFAQVMNVQTIPLGIRNYIGQQANRFDYMMAASVIVTIPVAIIFFVLQRHVISGLTAGAVKG